MKKKILFALSMVAIIVCLFAITVSAETADPYIEFKVKLSGANEYVNAYVIDVFPTDSKFDFNQEFYLDNDLTQAIDKDDIVGIDLSDATPKNNKTTAIKYVASSSTPYTSCKEIKWFNKTGCPTSIGTIFFQNWTCLESFDFGIATTVVDKAFNNTGLKTLTIPATVTTIKGGGFSGCKQLTSLTFEGNITSLSSSSFSDCTALVSVDFGDNMTTIGEGMFKNCTALASIEIPDNITAIKNQAFYNCTGLTSVEFPSTITSIGTSAFCKSGIGGEVIIPNSVTSIGNEAFANCKNVTSVVFEEGFSGTLGSSAFMGLKNLNTLVLSEGITAIPSQCFWSSGCGEDSKQCLVEKVVLPDSVKSLAGRAFNGFGTRQFIISENSQLESITGDAFAGMKFIKSIYLPDGVVISCDNLFQYCHALEEVQNFENVKINVSSYGENVFIGKIFYECMALKEIKVPYGTTVIAGTAWRYFGLEKLYIPETVTSINSAWLNDTTHMPSSAVIYYCGGDASKLLSLTDDGNGNVSTALKARIEAGNVIEYSTMNTEYASGAIVTNVNTCDAYFAGVHTWGELVQKFTGKAYLSSYVSESTCEKCLLSDVVSEICGPLFINKGYSVYEENGNGNITFGIYTDEKNIEAYEAFTKSKVSFGFVVGKENTALDGDIFDENGACLVSGAICTDFATIDFKSFSIYNLKLSGIATDSNKAQNMYCGAYVIDGTSVSYIGDSVTSKAVAISYNSLLEANKDEE